MATHRMLLPVTILLTAAALLVGCGQSADSAFVGSWGNTGDSTQPSLEIKDDGSVAGTDGCNRLMGSWSESDDVISFEQLASTRMACDGVDTWLSNASSGEIVDGQLVVSDEDGTEIGLLVQPQHG